MASARDWILVLFGRFIRERSGWISSRQLVALLEPLGADAASTRTAISRMKRSGFVESVERDGVAGYRLTRVGKAFFADGDRRVLERTDSHGRWVLASFSVPESQRDVRYKIRTRLLDLGFGQESAGLLVAPAGMSGEAERALRREGLDEWVSLWSADFGDLGSIVSVVERSWDLDRMRERYDEYVAQAERALLVDAASAAEEFVVYMLLTNEWRELSYIDPGLPMSAVPSDWPRPTAERFFERIEARLRPGADTHFDSVTISSPSVAA